MEAQRGGQMGVAIPNFITQNSNLVITWSSIKYAQIHINGDKTEIRMKDECQTRIVGKSNPAKVIFYQQRVRANDRMDFHMFVEL